MSKRAELHLIVEQAGQLRLRRNEEIVANREVDGIPEPLLRERASRDPAVAFVTKPWTVNELLKEIRALLERPVPTGTPRSAGGD